MSCTKGSPISVYRGDTYSSTFTITDGTNPIDITGWTIKFVAKKNLDTATEEINQTAVISDPINGIAILNLTANDTDIEANRYYYDIEFRSSSSDIVKTYQGTFDVCQDIA